VSHILEIRNLKINYGVHEAVHGLDMDIAEGKITAIIGSNGAGKTTIINAISGIVKREGTVIYRGRPLTQKAHRVVREGVVQVPEGRRVFAGLSVEENLRLGARTRFAIKNRSRNFWSSSTSYFHDLKSGKDKMQGHCPAVNSKCWRSVAV